MLTPLQPRRWTAAQHLRRGGAGRHAGGAGPGRRRRPGAESPPSTAPAATRSSAWSARRRDAACGRAVFVTDALAARLSADPARVDALGLRLEDGADPQQVAQRVQRAVGGESARTPAVTRQGGVACEQAAQRGPHLARRRLRRVRGAAGHLRRRRHARAVGAAARPGAGVASRGRRQAPPDPAAAAWGGRRGRAGGRPCGTGDRRVARVVPLPPAPAPRASAPTRPTW